MAYRSKEAKSFASQQDTKDLERKRIEARKRYDNSMPKKFAPQHGNTAGPKNMPAHRANRKLNPEKFKKVIARADRMAGGRFFGPTGVGGGLALAAAGVAGYGIGTALNKRYKLSERISEKAAKAMGMEGYASSGRSQVYTENARFAGNDVDGESAGKYKKHKNIKKKAKKAK